MSLNAAQKICVGFLGILLVFWLALFLSDSRSGFYNYLYSFAFGLIPLCGGLYAVISSHKWGMLQSAVGRSIIFIGSGLFLWGTGSVIWAYYNFFLSVPAPYPSLADLGYAPSVFLYGIGTIFLAQALGAKFALRSATAKIIAAGIIVAVAIFSYYILVVVARQGVLIPEGETLLKAVLDVAYPLGDFLGLSLAIVVSGLSFRYLSGNYKASILAILSGLAVMFIADSVFSYTTTVNTYYNADFGDLLLTLGMFLLTLGVLGFTRVQNFQTAFSAAYPRGLGTFEQIAVRIIREQEQILGPVAWEQAERVSGVRIIDQKAGIVIIDGTDKQMVIDVLAGSYENFFGKAARQISTEAIQWPDMRAVQDKVMRFSEERGWLKDAMPASYAKSISIEAAELLELFQWDHPHAEELLANPERLLKLQQELADVFIYGINLANILELDVMTIIQEKIAYNEKKYPAALLQRYPEKYAHIKEAYRRKTREAI